MTPELKTYYDNRFSMMSTQGWVDLMDDVASMLVSTNNLNGVTDEKTLHYRRGELSIINWLANLKSISEKAHDDIE